MKAPYLAFPSHSARPFGRWIAALLAVAAAGATARADHFYNAFTQEFDRTSGQGQRARAVATDSRGNVIVAGESINNNQVTQWYVAKYDGLDGHLLGTPFVLGPNNAGIGQAAPSGDCYVRSIAVDSSDNIIVAGGATFSATQEDFEVIKLNPQLGQIWARSRNGSNSGADEIQKVVVDASGNVYVTGFAADSGTGTDFVTIKYSSGGSVQYTKIYNNTGNSNDTPTDLAVDQTSGNVWVVGSTNVAGDVSFAVMQYDSTGAVVTNFPKVYSTPGLGFGASGVALDSAGSAFITGTYTALDNSHGLYTMKVGVTGIQLWTDVYTLSSGDFNAFAGGIAIGTDDNPIVTGTATAPTNQDVTEAVTIKYKGGIPNAGSRIWTSVDPGISPEDPNNHGFPEFNTNGRKVSVDGAGNAVVVGDSEGSADGLDIYVAKYSGVDGTLLFSSSFAGDFGSDDTGVAATTDVGGNIALTGTETRSFNGTGRGGIVTQKYQRIVAETADALPIDPVNNKARKISALNAPALADNSDLVGRITLTEGTAKLGAIFTQGAEGGTQLPVVQKMAAPNVPGFASATFTSFGDPIISPDGHYAFPAKLAGVPGSKANSIWTNLGGTLHLALEQGTPLPGLNTANVVSVTSISLRNSQLLALVKVNGAANANQVLVGLNSANVGTVLLRTNQPVTVNSLSSTVKTMTVLAPSPSSAGDGRWQGDLDTVVKATLADKRTVIFSVSPAANLVPIFYTGQDATAIAGSTDTWSTFGLPAVGNSGYAFSALGTLKTTATVKATTENAIVYSPTGSTFTLVGREGSSPDTVVDSSALLYTGFTNPISNSYGQLAFIATLKATPGGGAKVTAANNHALIFGIPSSQYIVARTGDKATDISGVQGTLTYSSFVSFALAYGTPGGPLFVAKLAGKGATAKNNLGVWAIDSNGFLRQLLRTGEKLGTQTVTNITLLKAVSQEFATARSFNNNGGVVMLVAFSDHSTGILSLQVP